MSGVSTVKETALPGWFHWVFAWLVLFVLFHFTKDACSVEWETASFWKPKGYSEYLGCVWNNLWKRW